MITKKKNVRKTRLTEEIKRIRLDLCYAGLVRLQEAGMLQRDQLVNEDISKTLDVGHSRWDIVQKDPSFFKGTWVSQYLTQLVENGVCKVRLKAEGVNYEIDNGELLVKITAIPPEQGNDYLMAALFPSEAGASLKALLAAEAGQVVFDEDTEFEDDTEPEPVESRAAVILEEEIRKIVQQELQQTTEQLKKHMTDGLMALSEVLNMLDNSWGAFKSMPKKLVDVQVAVTNIEQQQAQATAEIRRIAGAITTGSYADVRRLAADLKAVAQLTEDILGKVEKNGH